MSYKVIFDYDAIEFLNKLEEKIKDRIFSKIIKTKLNPHHFFERLKGRTEYKMRVGDYRVISDIDQKTMTIKIVLIGHRKNIYQNI